MEMQIMPLEQQTNAVAATSTSGVNAKYAANTAEGSFKSAFKKVLNDTSANGTTAAEQSEGAKVPVSDEIPDSQQELLSASMLAGIVIAPPVVAVAVTGEPAVSIPGDTGQGEKVGSEDLTVNASLLNDLAETVETGMPDGKNTNMSDDKLREKVAQQPLTSDPGLLMADDGGFNNGSAAPVQQDADNGVNNPKVETTSPGDLLPAQSQSLSQQSQNINGQAIIENVSVQQQSPALQSETKAQDTLSAAAQLQETPASGNAAGAETSVAVKVESATVEENTGQLNKEHTTNIPAPVAVATEQQAKSGYDLNNADTSDNQSTLTPLATGQTTRMESADMSFKMPEVPPPIKEQVLQSIVQRVKVMNNGSQQEISLQLKPENLGTLNIQIAMDNGAVTAKFQTDNPQVKQALEASFNQLKQDLQGQGFKVQHVAVSIAQQGMSFSEFSRRSPQFSLIKSKRIDKVEESTTEPAGTITTLIENYGESRSKGVDYKV